MRLLLLAQFFPPDIGGEERHVFNLANTLADRGHEVATGGGEDCEIRLKGRQLEFLVRAGRGCGCDERIPVVPTAIACRYQISLEVSLDHELARQQAKGWW